MKNIQKDIPSLLGLITTASLAVVSGGLINPATAGLLGSIGSAGSSIGASLAANFITKFTPAKLKKWFITEHPDKLNHSIKKLFIASISEALNNINILFSETDSTKGEKKAAKKLIKNLHAKLSDDFLKEKEIHLEEDNVKDFLYKENKEEMVDKFIETYFADVEIAEIFKSFLIKNLPAQIQLCFGEGLKDPAHQNAWIAFQRMLMEEIRNDIKNIAGTQEDIKKDLSDLKFTQSGLSKEQIAEIRELVEILNNKKLVEVKIKSSLDKSLQSIEAKANQIIKITTQTNITVSQLKTTVEKMKQQNQRQNRLNLIIVFSLAVCLFIAGTFIAYKLINQPFTATIQVYGWENEQQNPLDGKGILVLTLGDKTEKAEINRQGEALFKGILPQYNGKTVFARIADTQGEPYYLPDSLILIQKNSTTKVRVLLHGLEKLRGTVYDNISGEGLPNVSVSIADITAITDENGFFTIEIPIEKQKREQKILIRKEGYESKREFVSMTGEYNTILKQVKK